MVIGFDILEVRKPTSNKSVQYHTITNGNNIQQSGKK